MIYITLRFHSASDDDVSCELKFKPHKSSAANHLSFSEKLSGFVLFLSNYSDLIWVVDFYLMLSGSGKSLSLTSKPTLLKREIGLGWSTNVSRPICSRLLSTMTIFIERMTKCPNFLLIFNISNFFYRLSLFHRYFLVVAVAVAVVVVVISVSILCPRCEAG